MLPRCMQHINGRVAISASLKLRKCVLSNESRCSSPGTRIVVPALSSLHLITSTSNLLSCSLKAFEARPAYIATKSDYYTHVMDIPPQYGPGFGVKESALRYLLLHLACITPCSTIVSCLVPRCPI